jgi:hypothetical protein
MGSGQKSKREFGAKIRAIVDLTPLGSGQNYWVQVKIIIIWKNG